MSTPITPGTPYLEKNLDKLPEMDYDDIENTINEVDEEINDGKSLDLQDFSDCGEKGIVGFSERDANENKEEMTESELDGLYQRLLEAEKVLTKENYSLYSDDIRLGLTTKVDNIMMLANKLYDKLFYYYIFLGPIYQTE